MTKKQAYEDAVEFARCAPVAFGQVDLLINRPSEGVHVPVAQLTLDRAAGIVGDRWSTTAWKTLADGAPDPRIQVSLTNTKVMRCFTGPAPNAVHGCGDNLYVDFNLTEAQLPVGTRLKVGSAVLEVSDVVNDACGKFAQRFGADALKWVRSPENAPLRLRGIFCTIVASGQVSLGDRIERSLQQ